MKIQRTLLILGILFQSVYLKKNLKKNFAAQCGRSFQKPTIQTTGRIIHGDNSIPNQWPWHVAVFFKLGIKHNFFCGGSILNQNHILTAAHCFDELPSFLELYVGVGLFNLSDAKPNKNLFKVSKLIRHENYNKSNAFDNDIALLVLEKPIKYTNKISPICLPSNQDVKLVYNKVLHVAGWGSIHEKVTRESIPNSLMQLEIKIMNYFNETLCQGIDETKYCGYDMSDKHSNLCVGDSGGALMHKIDQKWYVFGVVSFGNAEFSDDNLTILCQANQPTYFTIVPNYLDWIEKNVEANLNNKKF
ncbi:unnamed protein product [Brachionus calyciflorus]|uniref:Peptidase S1 domain-containing protein n=1 Tax=Brachionus calyciflorus TaxID=104777 RepID=A0A814J2D5_9BILA|nr:unnamed protein product [Brachionus calyciflorus]